MENTDIVSAPRRRPAMPEYLADSLWDGATRDPQLSPLYIRRYAGPRHPQGRSDAHDFWELTYTFAGEGVLESDLGQTAARPGMALLIPPGLAHRELAEVSGWDVLWVGLEGRETDAWPTDQGVVTATASALQASAEQLWLWSSRQPGAVGPELDSLTAFVIRASWRLATGRAGATDDWLARVLDYMHDHLAADLEMADLARVADRSLGHFQRSFKAATGETPLAYLTRIRLDMALVYLRESTHSVARVAALCGYHDPLYFSKLCRHHLGHPPTALRR